MQLGIATCAKCPELTVSERPLVSLLHPHRIEAAPVVWNDPSVNWASFDALLIRSTWDYHLFPQKFLAWLQHLEQLRIPVWNPVPVLRWNSHKFYLRDLAGRGVAVAPTLYLEKGRTDVREQALEKGWTDVVIKPAVSASGYRTHSVSLESPEAQSTIEEASAHGDFLVQPFIPSIRETGEVSLVFFDNEFSHAVLKRPREGEFRVQAEYGGNQIPIEPPTPIVEEAMRILQQTATPLLYARVDGMIEDNRFLLMELELIEPDLFLSLRPGSDKEFASRLAKRLRPPASS